MNSSDTAKVAHLSVVFSGSYPNCSAVITPIANASGTVTITLAVSDGNTSSLSSFTLTMIYPSTISDITNRGITRGTSTPSIPFTISGPDLICDNLHLSMSSSDSTKVTNSAVVFGGNFPSCTAVITPIVNAGGTVSITITVSNGVSTASDAFNLTITNAVVAAPTPIAASLHSTTYNAAWTSVTNGNSDHDEAKLCSDSACSASCGAVTNVLSPAPKTATFTGLADGASYYLCVRSIDIFSEASSWAASTLMTNTLPRVSISTLTSSFSERSGNSKESWWDTDYSKRRKLKFHALTLPENLTDFPVLVVLNSSRINYSLAGSNGAKLHFVDANGITELDWEVESWNSSGRSYIWVKVPQINASSASDFIWMYYDGADDTHGSTVWPSYRAVWHMDTPFSDSTLNNTGSIESSPASPSAVGVIGNARKFNAAEYINTNYVPNSANSSGFTVWLRTEDSSTAMFLGVADPEVNQNKFELGANGAGLIFFHYGYGANLSFSSTFKSSIWEHWAVVQNSGTVYVYRNGVQVSSGANTTSSTTRPFYIGARRFTESVDNQIRGLVDEVRIYNATVPSATRIRAEYLTAKDAMISYGAEEVSTPSPSATITVTLDFPAQETIVVPYNVGGTATAADHSLVAGSITFNSTESTKSTSFQIFRDGVIESPAETVTLSLQNPTGNKATLGTNTVYTGTITDPVFASCEDTFDSGLYESAVQTLNLSLTNNLGTYSSTASCDFSDTLENRPWTMVLNYLHQGAATIVTDANTTALPLANSSTLGIDEKGSPEYWGHTHASLLAIFRPVDLRFYCKTSAHARIVEFSTTSCLDYFSSGTGSCAGINNNYQPFPNHTASLPATTSAMYTDGGTSAMINHTFYTPSTRHWIFTSEPRAECDNYLNGAGSNTLHRIWVRTQPASPASTMTSCKAYRDTGSTRSGIYWLYDATAPTVPYKAYCDMESDGGGWTLVLKSMISNTDFQYASSRWASATPELNSSDFDFTSTNTSNALYNTYKRVFGREIRMSFLNAGNLMYTADATGKTAQQFATTATVVNIKNSSAGTTPANCGDWPSIMGIVLHPTWALQARAGAIGTKLHDDTNASFGAGARFGLLGNNEVSASSTAITGPSWDSAVGIGIRNYDAAGTGNLGSGIVGWVEVSPCNNLNTASGNSPGNTFKQTTLWIR